MSVKFLQKTILTVTLFIGLYGSASAANITPYYLFDGEHQQAYEIKDGVVANTFPTFGFAYAPAIRNNTIWLSHRQSFAREYTLDGIATGNIFVGGNSFSESLYDGATGSGGLNYGVRCCVGRSNFGFVTVANSDWSNESLLFNLPIPAGSIAFDPTDSTLYVSWIFENHILHVDLTGHQLGFLNVGQRLVGLAYEALTNSFWGWNSDLHRLVEFDRAGSILQSFAVAGVGGRSMAMGGEMQSARSFLVPWKQLPHLAPPWLRSTRPPAAPSVPE